MMDLWPDRKASCSSTTFLLKLLLQLSSLIFSQHVILPIDGRRPFLGTTLNLRPCPPAALIISLRSLRLGGQLFPTVYHQGWNYGSTYVQTKFRDGHAEMCAKFAQKEDVHADFSMV